MVWRLGALVLLTSALVLGASSVAYAANEPAEPANLLPPAEISTESPVANSAATQTTETTEPGTIEVSRNGTEARGDNISFAVTDFLRSNKGTNKTYNNHSFGYRYPVAGPNAFALVAAESALVVYVPAATTQTLGLNFDEPATQEAFKKLIEEIDERVANGNLPLKTLTAPFIFTSEPSFTLDDCVYQFGVEVEPGYYYVSISADSNASGAVSGSSNANTNDPDNASLSTVAHYVNSGMLVPASDVVIDSPPQGVAAVWEFFGGIDYRPFWVSLRTSLVAMIFVFVLGLAAALYSLRINERLRAVLDSIFTIPMVLPPTVCGFLLLVAFGNSTGFGRWLIDHGVVLVFTWPGAVIAAFVVAFPLMYRTARGAFESLDPNLGDAARTLGWSGSRVFFKLTLPLAWPSIAAGTVLSFARALGEFGATLFVAGNFAGITQTMPLAIYFQWMGGHTEVATFWVVVVILISFLFILFINWYAARVQRYRQAGADIDQDEVCSCEPHSSEARSPEARSPEARSPKAGVR